MRGYADTWICTLGALCLVVMTFVLPVGFHRMFFAFTATAMGACAGAFYWAESWVIDNRFDPDEWERKKQASRNQDDEDLRTGRKTREQLWKENSAMSTEWKPDRKRAPKL